MPTKHGRDNKQNGRKAFAQYLSPTPYVKPNYPPPPPLDTLEITSRSTNPIH